LGASGLRLTSVRSPTKGEKRAEEKRIGVPGLGKKGKRLNQPIAFKARC